MVAQKFLDLVGFALLEGNVVRISAEDVFELAFKFVNVIIVFSCEVELYLFVFGD